MVTEDEVTVVHCFAAAVFDTFEVGRRFRHNLCVTAMRVDDVHSKKLALERVIKKWLNALEKN